MTGLPLSILRYPIGLRCDLKFFSKEHHTCEIDSRLHPPPHFSLSFFHFTGFRDSSLLRLVQYFYFLPDPLLRSSRGSVPVISTHFSSITLETTRTIPKYIS